MIRTSLIQMIARGILTQRMSFNGWIYKYVVQLIYLQVIQVIGTDGHEIGRQGCFPRAGPWLPQRAISAVRRVASVLFGFLGIRVL